MFLQKLGVFHDNPHLYGVIKDERAASAVMKVMRAALQNALKSVTRTLNHFHFPGNNIVIHFICVLVSHVSNPVLSGP